MPEVKTIYNRLKNSAKKRGMPFNLNPSDLHLLSYPVSCPILGIPLKYNRGKAQDDSYSIDRIDSSLGYTADNIVVISYKANRLKNNATASELTKISDYYNNSH